MYSTEQKNDALLKISRELESNRKILTEENEKIYKRPKKMDWAKQWLIVYAWLMNARFNG